MVNRSSAFYRLAMWLSLVAGLTLAGDSAAPAADYKEVVEAAAEELATYLQQAGKPEASVRPQFRGLPSTPGGAAVGFSELLKTYLAPHGIQISNNADFTLEARIELTENEANARLLITIFNRNGRKLNEITTLPVIDNATDLAEVLGITTFVGARATAVDRWQMLTRALDERKILTGQASPGLRNSLLVGERNGLYGIGLLVNGQNRLFRKQDGLAYTDLEFGEEYTVLLVNDSTQEVAVDLKIDGVNVFHFSDPDLIRPGKTNPRYWTIGPKSRVHIRGWYRNPKLLQAFAITPIQEGAAVKAGLPLEDVGLITATFHACWSGDTPPDDEPKQANVVEPSSPQPDSEAEPESFPVPQPEAPLPPGPGSFPEPGSESLPTPASPAQPESPLSSSESPSDPKPATGFGKEIQTNHESVKRTVGVPRAVLAFRYDRPRN